MSTIVDNTIDILDNSSKIVIDIRETELLSKIKTMTNSNNNNVNIVSLPLEIGDIHFIINGIEYAIIERKTLRDLASSIKDGRYEEQSYRLNGHSLHNHHISYLIEGDLTKWNDRSISRNTLYSALTSIQYVKGFSVIRTMNLEDTAHYIYSSFIKLCKIINENKPFYYLSTEEEIKPNYCSVIKKTKKENITSENMTEIILSQIPGISVVTANAITVKYNTISTLIAALKENPSVLREVQYTNNKGQLRKINKNSGETIMKYLSIQP
jgi:ERCC4-type nuclease